MPTRTRYLAAAFTSLLILSATDLFAQERFGVVSQHTIAGVSDLRTVTIRDSLLSECYTLFIMESRVLPDTAPAPLPDDATDQAVQTEQAVQRIRDASARRDQQLAELKAQVDRTGSWDVTALGRFERDRQRVEEEYEGMLRTEIAGSYPWAAQVPGRTGGWADAANAMRRALLDPNPTSTMRSMIDEFDRLDGLLRRLIEAPRMAVSGPVKCP